MAKLPKLEIEIDKKSLDRLESIVKRFELVEEKFTSTNRPRDEIISCLQALPREDRLSILREFCRMGGCK
jgi:hypothetical protein